MNDEPPDLRRERRLAEARAQRGTAARAEQVAVLQREKAAERRNAASKRSGRRTPENSPDMFGHPWPVWFAMRDAALAYMKVCASEGRLTSYRETWAAVEAALGEDLGNPWRQIPSLLGYVSVHAYPELDLIPTALVVTPDSDDEPGPGFFRIAAELGALDDAESPPEGESWTMSQAQRDYWQVNVQGMFDRFAPTSG